MSPLCHAVHVVLSHASAVLTAGAIIARRPATTLILVGSTLTCREARQIVKPLLTLQELDYCERAYGFASEADAWLDLPMFVPPMLAHPSFNPVEQYGQPLVRLDCAELQAQAVLAECASQ